MKYQGKEFTSTLQAPNKGGLDSLIISARRFAASHGMDNFKILERGKDPDGGHRAIITAHNWNPISWIKEKIAKRREPDMDVPKLEEASEESQAAKEEEKKEKGRKKAQERLAKEEAEREKREEEERYKKREEEFLKSIPPSQRKRVRKGIPEAQRASSEAVLEIMGQAVPESITQYYKTLQKEHWTSKATGQPVPEPRTAEERAEAEYHPSQWTYLPVEKKLSSPERLAVARTLELEGMEMEVARDKYKEFKRERSFSGRAAKTVAGGLGAVAGIGQFAMGAATMGVAGMARSTQGSRVGRERATRMHAPGVPMELYGVRPMLGVGIPPSSVHTGAGLAHLRALTLTGIRRPRTQVRQTVQQVRRSSEQEF